MVFSDTADDMWSVFWPICTTYPFKVMKSVEFMTAIYDFCYGVCIFNSVIFSKYCLY